MIYAGNVTAVSRRAATKAGRGICLGAENIGENQYENDVLVAQQWRAQHVKPSQKCFGALLDAVRRFRMLYAHTGLKDSLP